MEVREEGGGVQMILDWTTLPY